MSYTHFSRINTDQLYMPFLKKLFAAVEACAARGFNYVATDGLRTPGQQLADWMQGRTKPGRIITHAGPFESAHQFGLAVDFVLMVGVTPSWADVDYVPLGEEAEKQGLVWGGCFKRLMDRPHVQWPGYVTAGQLAPLKEIWLAHQEAPLSAVWAHLDSMKGSEA